MKKIHFVILVLFSCVFVNAQGTNLNLTGDAKEVDSLFYKIDLVNGANQTGGAWYPQSFNLDSSFSVDTYVSFGQFGAEGFAIVLNSDSIPVGFGANQLGVPNTGKSFIVEFDLQQNSSNTDATVPHASFFKNGSLIHQGEGLLQDGIISQRLYENEPIRINWDVSAHRFTVKRFGCTDSVLSYSGDIKNTIFEGNSRVFLGYTAATSTLSDTISLLLHYNSEGVSQNQTVCKGEEIVLHAYNGISTNWSSDEPYVTNVSDEELQLHGVSYEIVAKPVNSAYYIVTNLDFCGYNYDSIWVEVLDTLSFSTEVVKYEIKNTVDISLIVDEGQAPYSVEWTLPDLSISSGQELLGVPFGEYQLTVTNGNNCSSNLMFEFTQDPITEPSISTEISTQDYFSPNGDGQDDYIKINVQGESKIVDFKGRVLKVVTFGELWDGTSEAGELLHSGVYIVVGEEGKQVITILR